MRNIILLFFIVLCGVTLVGQNCQTAGDRDGDGICDDVDPCPDVFNMNPVDLDGDNVYDECDNSPLFNPDQSDIDGDGIGDVSDTCIDPDRDGICGSADKCPGSDDRIDVDNDRIPDGCDDCIDRDRDGVCDDVDDCISTDAGKSCDDGDDCTMNDRLDEFCNCDGTLRDEDGDGVCDLDDKCPGSDDRRDYDNDGIPDGCDDSPNCTACESDSRGRITMCHVFPNGRAQTNYARCDQIDQYFNNEGFFVSSKDHCGPCNCADEGDVDTDGDGICDKKDPCPNDATDTDGDGVCDSLDVCPGSDDRQDSDADGIPDGCDDLQYCAPTYDNTMEWIAAIRINGSTLNNRQSNDLTLHNEDIRLEKGSAYELVITPEFIDNICEVSIAVYIDRNGDGDFDDRNEELYSGRTIEEVMLSMNIDNYEVGTYRMRVMMHYGRIAFPCQSDIDGEVEDLLLEVIGQQPCSGLLESFEYDANQGLAGLNGGEGWIGEWQVSSSEADQVVVLSNSLNDNDKGNKIGILNNGASTVQLKRDVDIDLGGSENVYLSMNIERISGEGSLNIQIGEVTIGINGAGNLYMNTTVGNELSEGVIYRLQLSAKVDLSEEDDLTLVAMSPDGNEIVLSESVELGSIVNILSITTISTNSFLPLAHYVDNISIGCEESVVVEANSPKGQSYKKELSINESALSVDIWPNPSVGENTSILITGEGDLFNYELVDITGRRIGSGAFFNGYNKLPQGKDLSGLYYLLVSDGSQTNTVKLIR